MTQGENVNPCPQKKTKKKENSPSKEGEKAKKIKKKERKFPIEEWEKAKKERKFPIKDRKKAEEICRKVFGLDNI